MKEKEKIIAEIERLKIEKRKENLPFHAFYYDGYDAACDKIIAYLNTHLAEQPSDDLEDEIYNYWRNELTTEDIVTISKDDFIFHATHFAQWQKEQMMESAIEVKINRDTLYNLKPIIHEKYQDLRIGDKILIIKEAPNDTTEKNISTGKFSD